MKNRKIYIFINIIAMLISIIFAGKVLLNFQKVNYKLSLISIIFIILIVLAIKFIRIYLILLEEKLSLRRFLKIYIKCVFATVCVPFKLGEIFKMYCYSYEMKNMKRGIISVIIDRYFDTLALVLLLIPIELYTKGVLSILSIALTSFIIIITVIYLSLMPMINYLNKFIILNVNGSKGIYCLRMLDNIELLYSECSKFINRKLIVLLMIFSCIAWGMEYIAIHLISLLTNVNISINDFTIYLSSMLTGSGNKLVSVYITVEMILLAVITFTIYVLTFYNKMKKRR